MQESATPANPANVPPAFHYEDAPVIEMIMPDEPISGAIPPALQ